MPETGNRGCTDPSAVYHLGFGAVDGGGSGEDNTWEHHSGQGKLEGRDRSF